MGNRGLRIALRIILVLSLLLNAVLVGLFLRLNAVRSELGISGPVLSFAERQTFRNSAFEDPALQAALDEMRQARAAMVDTLAADPFVAEDAETAMAEVRQKTEALQIAAQRLVLDIVLSRD